MRGKLFVRILVGVALALIVSSRAHAAEFDQSHALFDKVLKSYVKDARVNYAVLKVHPQELDRYLGQVAVVSETDFKRWTEKQQIAFLINLYNATTLKLVVDHYPVKSIKDIGGLFSGPWKQKVVHLFGNVTTLNEVEHGVIRKQYPDARAHFALVCAAKGCPPLRAEAYAAARLDEQLDEQGRVFLGQMQKNRVDAGARTINLSPIFKWFSGDFEKKSGSVLNFVEPFLSAKDRQALATGGFIIKYTDYDWSLNDQAQK